MPLWREACSDAV